MVEIKINNTVLWEFAEYQMSLAIRNKKIVDKYITKLNQCSNIQLNSIYDLYECNTGAIFLKDEEAVIMANEFSNHPIFKIYDCDCLSNYRKYTCNLDDKIILRGPNNYYFGFCNLGDIDISIKDIKKTILDIIGFFHNVEKQLYFSDCNLEEENILNLKLVLAIFDCIRNSLDINLFFLLSLCKKEEAIYFYKNYKDNPVTIIYELLREVISEVYFLLFKARKIRMEKVSSVIKTFMKIEYEILKFIDENKFLLNKNLYLHFRKYREADNVIENLICIDHSINELIKQYTKEEINDKNIFVLGLNYGSIELAIMVELILASYDIECSTGNIMKKFREVMIKPKDVVSWTEIDKIEGNNLCILVDENILTGNTIKCAVDYLKEKGFEEICKVIIKYPTVARLKNIVNECRDGDVMGRFKDKIFGLTFATPYSKFCEYREDFIFPYMDKLGTFDLSKYFIFKHLYKNGIYKKGSAIDRISVYYKDFFV